MDRKVIFLDIDGTLTEPGSNIPPESALNAVKAAQKKGHYVFLCTGRNYQMLSPLLHYGFDGVIASSGGYIKYQDKILFDCPMSEVQKKKAMDTLKENGIFRTVECLDGSFTDEGFKEFLRENAGEGGNSELLRWRLQIEKSLGILPMEQYQGQPVYKIVFMSKDMESLENPIEILKNEFSFCIQEPDSYGFVNGELVNRKFDKGKGVGRVSRYLKIPIQNTIAFGDSMNDKEMIEAAGIGVCMENGSSCLKKISDYVCAAVKEDGICRAFEKFGLI